MPYVHSKKSQRTTANPLLSCHTLSIGHVLAAGDTPAHKPLLCALHGPWDGNRFWMLVAGLCPFYMWRQLYQFCGVL